MKVPCFHCLKDVETTSKDVVAELCSDCSNSEDLTKILKYLTIKKLNKILKMFNAKHKSGKLTEHGEII